MTELLEFLVKALVEDPEAVEVEDAFVHRLMAEQLAAQS